MPITKVIKYISLFITPTKLLSVNLPVITLLLVSGIVMLVHAEEKQVQKIHFTNKEQAWISKHPEVIVGFVPDMQPALIVGENGQHQGILPEFYALLSQHTGINFHIKLSPTWSEMLTEGRKKKTDMIGSFVPNLKFRAHFDFTHAILSTHFYIYGADEIQPQEFSLDNLPGKKVGYIKAHRNIERWSTKHKNIDFITYKDRDSLVKALTTGQVEFLINAEPLEYWRQQHGLISFKKIHAIPELSTDIVMGVRKDWPELTSILNKVLSSTKIEQHAITDHWLGFNKNRTIAKNPVQLTAEEKSWIAEHPVIRVGFDPFWAPLEFLGENGQPKGVSIQYLHHLETTLGLHFEFAKNLSWPEALKKLEVSQLDVLPAVSITHPKRDLFNFTSPYLSTHNGIFSATDRAYLGGVDALKGKRALFIEGNAIQSWLKENYPEVDWVSAPNISTALKEVASGDAFAFVGNLITTSYYIGQSGLTQIKVVGEVSFTNDLALAVRKDWEILTSILQKGLDAIPQNERDAIYNDWISIKYKHSVDYTL